MKKEDNLSIFEEAAMQIVPDDDVPITEENVTLPIPHKARKTFNALKKGFEAEHAERFNQVLHSLPDREFVRVYLRALEFFKPKITREVGKRPPAKDNTINIQINKH
jgi:hypothetical protein